MLKVDVPFGGENAKFGYKDGIFYYLIIFTGAGNVCGYKVFIILPTALTLCHFIFYVPICSTSGIVPCVAQFNCSTGGRYIAVASPEWRSPMEQSSFFYLIFFFCNILYRIVFCIAVYKTKEALR